jgi:deoxyribodipyrimidine photo-lyase
MTKKINVFWFRRDLRLDDNAGLFQALSSDLPVLPIFIFDKNILNHLQDKSDRRVSFIHNTIEQIQKELVHSGSSLHVFYDTPENAFHQLSTEYDINAVFTNDDYEGYAIKRDAQIRATLASKNIGFHSCKDHVIFEKSEVTKDDGLPYTVFTPYSKKWKTTLESKPITIFNCEKLAHQFLKSTPRPVPTLESMGFQLANFNFPSAIVAQDIIKKYAETRDIPGIRGTSQLGIHLRFGTISVRQLALQADKLSTVFLNELIWRDFYQMILWHFPHVNECKSFKKAYDNIEWRNNEAEFKKWCEGQTGYPIVDAGMRELNETGFMHNRVRMITASFLCKHLLIDWRWGEAYFAEKLLDFDFASNNGGWQWAAGSGCDAAPYFRIFNPYLQTKKFDPDFKYIRKWVPEFEEFNYPTPIVNHEFARKRCLETYAKAIK